MRHRPLARVHLLLARVVLRVGFFFWRQIAKSFGGSHTSECKRSGASGEALVARLLRLPPPVNSAGPCSKGLALGEEAGPRQQRVAVAVGVPAFVLFVPCQPW